MHSPDDKLTARELHAITGTTRLPHQAAKLAKLGLPFMFTPTRITVRRVLAQAHGLLPEREMAGEVRLDLLRR